MVFVYQAYQTRPFKSGCNVDDCYITWTLKSKSRFLYSNYTFVCVEDNPSSAGTIRKFGQQIRVLLRQPKFHTPIHKGLPSVCTPSHMKLFHYHRNSLISIRNYIYLNCIKVSKVVSSIYVFELSLWISLFQKKIRPIGDPV